jgi:hypothetical protein
VNERNLIEAGLYTARGPFQVTMKLMKPVPLPASQRAHPPGRVSFLRVCLLLVVVNNRPPADPGRGLWVSSSSCPLPAWQLCTQ